MAFQGDLDISKGVSLIPLSDDQQYSAIFSRVYLCNVIYFLSEMVVDNR